MGKVYFKIFHFYAPNFEEVDGAYWFRVVRPSVCQESCMLRFLNFIYYGLISDGKIADPYFFSCPSYLPFWSYAPLKKSE